MIKIIYVLLILGVSCTANAELYAVDGDSLEGDGRRIRLEGIDAPEYKQYCFTADNNKYDCGADSLSFLQNLMKNKKINCKCEEERDRYNRELCVCYADKLNLNKAMVKNGRAVCYRSKRYKSAEKNAKNKKLGIWQGKFMRPALYRMLLRKHRLN